MAVVSVRERGFCLSSVVVVPARGGLSSWRALLPLAQQQNAPFGKSVPRRLQQPLFARFARSLRFCRLAPCARFCSLTSARLCLRPCARFARLLRLQASPSARFARFLHLRLLCLLGAGFPHGAPCNSLRKSKTRHSLSPSRVDYSNRDSLALLARFALQASPCARLCLRPALALLAYACARWLRPCASSPRALSAGLRPAIVRYRQMARGRPVKNNH